MQHLLVSKASLGTHAQVVMLLLTLNVLAALSGQHTT